MLRRVSSIILILAAILSARAELSKISVNRSRDGFETPDGKPFIPFGVTYYRPGTGWAPQVWKKFDPEATRRDFALMKKAGVNCARVFLSYGSFYTEPGRLDPEGLRKFNTFLQIAEDAGIYVHPTGPDHWEGLPPFAARDRIADETNLDALEKFWELFAARYRNRNVIFAYDLRNEPEVAWDTPVMRERWAAWIKKRYRALSVAGEKWGTRGETLPIPSPDRDPRTALLRDYQDFREDLADDWTKRQSTAIRRADPKALVTVGLIQWSVPVCLPRVGHYSGFNPERQARWVDFLEIHFYPLANGAYEYRQKADEEANLAYLHAVVSAVAAAGKPVVIGEFGWYGGGQPSFDHGKHPAATEEQQARWCSNVVATTSSMASGWFNWGFYDQPEATDVSQLTGLYKSNGEPKAWGRAFTEMARALPPSLSPVPQKSPPAPELPWIDCLTSNDAAAQYKQRYLDWFRAHRLAPK